MVLEMIQKENDIKNIPVEELPQLAARSSSCSFRMRSGSF